MRFPGQRHDAATGLYHNYFRDYDPTIGRYVQSDPIGLAGGISTYAYGNGAPLGFSDPLGLRGNPLSDMFGRMIARPIAQRMGGGLLARGASAAAKARAQARRAAELAQRMQGIWGRIARGGRRGSEEPQGCGNVKIATEGHSNAGRGNSLLLNEIRAAGGTLPVSRKQITTQDIAGASRAGGNEIAYYRDRASGQLYLRELGPQMGNIPENSRLILHTQPGSMSLSVQPSAFDRAALSALGQRSSVIVNFEGTFAIRFRANNASDGSILWIGN
jgi:RHS repeat-associated protein